MLGLGELRDLRRGVPEREQRVPSRQYDRIEERLMQATKLSNPPDERRRETLTLCPVRCPAHALDRLNRRGDAAGLVALHPHNTG
jgi:hypothetical protein